MGCGPGELLLRGCRGLDSSVPSTSSHPRAPKPSPCLLADLKQAKGGWGWDMGQINLCQRGQRRPQVLNDLAQLADPLGCSETPCSIWVEAHSLAP